MSLLECPNVICSVSSHQGDVSEALEPGQDVLLLGGGNTSVDPSILDEDVAGRGTFVMLESSASHANIVFFKECFVQGVGGFDGDDNGIIDTSPYKVFDRLVSYIIPHKLSHSYPYRSWLLP